MEKQNKTAFDFFAERLDKANNNEERIEIMRKCNQYYYDEFERRIDNFLKENNGIYDEKRFKYNFTKLIGDIISEAAFINMLAKDVYDIDMKQTT